MLIKRAALPNATPARAARDAQTAVAVEILLMAPLRIANLAMLGLGKHIHLDPADRDSGVISLSEAETKNALALEFQLPAESTRLIRRYVERFLPTLSAPGCDALFPGRAGKTKVPTALGAQVKKAVLAETGCVLNAHLFRHLGAKAHLDDNPGDYEVVRRVLGHKSIDTTTSFYTGFETAAAARHFDASILARRRRAESSLHPRRGRGLR